jgi:aspartate kinase
MQNSAISFSVVVDNNPQKIPQLINELKPFYKVLYNENIDLVTIRHYNQPAIDKVVDGKIVLLEQKSRNTIRMVLK